MVELEAGEHHEPSEELERRLTQVKIRGSGLVGKHAGTVGYIHLVTLVVRGAPCASSGLPDGRLQQAAHTICSALCFADQMAGTRRILFKAAFTAMVGPLELQLFSVTGRHTLTPSAAASICDATIVGDWSIRRFTVLFTPSL